MAKFAIFAFHSASKIRIIFNHMANITCGKRGSLNREFDLKVNAAPERPKFYELDFLWVSFAFFDRQKHLKTLKMTPSNARHIIVRNTLKFYVLTKVRKIALSKLSFKF